jgi:ketosteroid isomerase-like protein
MLYHFFVKRLIRQSFDHVNNRNWDALLSSIAPNIHHRFAGNHALGGERHDKETLRRWFERVGRVLPNLHLEVKNIWVKGWPWHTTVLVHALDVFEDSQEVVRGLTAQAAAGLNEAIAEKIES